MDRHLLPNEIDLLLDGEAGFGIEPLRAHVRKCAECRSELEESRALVRELEHLPRFSASPLFAEHVMARVQIYVPWHVTLLDTVRGWLPQSRAGRAVAGAGAFSMATVLTVVSLWMLARLDTLVFATTLGFDQARRGVAGAVAGAMAGLIGEPALSFVRSTGWMGLAIGLLAFLGMTAGAATVVRGIVVRTRDR